MKLNIKVLLITLLMCISNHIFAQITDSLADNSLDAAPLKTTVTETNLQVDKQATFPGGNQNINPFIAKNIIYPKEAIEQEIQGKVLVSFTVMKDGSVSNIKVQKPVHPILDKAAIEVIKKMPKWEPATYKDEPVSTLYTIPINFKLQ